MHVYTKTCAQRFIAAFFRIAKGTNNPNVHYPIIASTKCGRFMQWNNTEPQERIKY